ncbi:MAG TPA: ATP-binding protein [Anaerohalosphaeraceae bacterium]|nr:ATP-binding protein [Anaerohalosphaeraceae bacterium]
MKMLSMKSRIGLCIAGVIVLVLGVLLTVSHYEFEEAQFRNLDYRLRTDAEAVRQIILSDGLYTEDAEKEVRMILESRAGTKRLGYAVWEGTSEVWLQKADLLDVRDFLLRNSEKISAKEEIWISSIDGGSRGRVLWARYSIPDSAGKGERLINIAMAISDDSPYHETAEFTRLLILIGIGLLSVSMAAVYGIFRWGFRPIDVLTKQMGQISGRNVSQVSFDFPPMPTELLPFVKAWQVMLQRLSEAMEEQQRFISDAAHELRTPLALMKSTLQLSQSQPRSVDFYKRTISQTLEDLERLNRLVQQMLELSRLESLPAQLEQELFDLGLLLEEVVEQYMPYAQERGFRLDYEKGSAWVRAHREQMRRLFCNLLDNAIQYGPAGTPIAVRMKSDERFVRVDVHDEGGRIPPEEQPFLFRRFYRVHKARDRDSGGTGLGLAIAREIAVLHGGDISVRSSPQEGTTFTVSVPLNRER